MNSEYLQWCETLGVAPGASLAEIKQAYRDLALLLHPDRCHGNVRLAKVAEERFKKVQDAFERLKAHLECGGGYQTPPPQPPPVPPPPPPPMWTTPERSEPPSLPKQSTVPVAAIITFFVCLLILPSLCRKTVVDPGLIWNSSHEEIDWKAVFGIGSIAAWAVQVVAYKWSQRFE